MFATAIHLNPNLIFLGKVRSLLLEWSPVSKTFYGCDCCCTARMFATAIHLHSSLIFLGKARSLLLEWSPVSKTFYGRDCCSVVISLNV